MRAKADLEESGLVIDIWPNNIVFIMYMNYSEFFTLRIELLLDEYIRLVRI